MSKPSSIFKNKKTLFFIFLSIFICSSLFFTSTIIKAQGGGGIEGGESAAFLSSNPPSQSDADSCGVDFKTLYKSLVAGFSDMIVWIPETIAKIIVSISSGALGISKMPITQGSAASNGAGAKAFTTGWQSTRDLANMMIVLGFVIIGIATSLRIKDYEAKKALLPLIVVALLVNFSGLFCGLIIDASNITMDGLVSANGSATTGMATTFMRQIGDIESKTKCGAIGEDNLSKYISLDVSYAFIYSAIAVAFFLLAALLIARYAILGILYMLSPIAFVCYAFPFPKAKGLFEKWWGYFLNWAFVGVMTCFFLSIAGKIAENIDVINMDWGGTLTSLLIVLAVIIVGIFVSVKSSAAGAGAVIGAAAGVAGFAAGAVMGGAKGLDRMTGGLVADTGKGISRGYGKALENVGLRDRGSTIGKDKAEVEESAKRMGNLDEDSLKRAAQGRGFNEKDRNAAVLHMARTGRLSDIGTDEQQSVAVDRAMSHYKALGITSATEGKGSLKSMALKQNPNIATDPADAKKAVEGQTDKEFTQNIDAKSINEKTLAFMRPSQIAHTLNNGSQAKKDSLDKMFNTRDGQRSITEHFDKLTAAGRHDDANNLMDNFSEGRRLYGARAGYTPTPEEEDDDARI